MDGRLNRIIQGINAPKKDTKEGSHSFGEKKKVKRKVRKSNKILEKNDKILVHYLYIVNQIFYN